MNKVVNFICITTLLFAFNLLSTSTYAQPSQALIRKETVLYSIKGKDSLFLDRYYKDTIVKSKQPCLIFVFGGGFFTGKRDKEAYIPYYNWLTEKGMQVIAIDYRLGLKPLVEQMSSGAKEKPKLNPFKMVDLLFNSVNIAVEDLYDATNFVISSSKKWNIDTTLILSCGSSAGAITVLQGEYYKTSGLGGHLSSSLPNNFNYAGVISFAGAIAKKHGKVKWNGTPAPIQMFHGNADSNVPYGKMKTILGSLYGSEFIADELNKMGVPYYFLSAENATHSIAETPMNIYRDQIWEFIDKMVFAGEPLIINESIKMAGEPAKNTKFGIKDYVKANFIPHANSNSMLSYNVHNCIATDATRSRNYKVIANIIKNSGAQVVAIQELDSMTTRTPLYVLGELEKETGMHGTYASAINYAGGKYGIGILSAQKPIAVKRIPLPGREENRVFLIAEFDNFIFCCTHLSLTPADQLASITIIRSATKEFVKENTKRKHKPLFIGGDFNATPGSSTIEELLKHATPVSNDALKTFPANAPNRCIDYLFLLDRKMPKKMEVISSGRIVNEKTHTASDHLPVYSVITY